MSEFYYVQYSTKGCEVVKTCSEDYVVEIFDSDMNSFFQLLEDFSYYILETNIWDTSDEIFFVVVRKNGFSPDGKLVDREEIEKTEHFFTFRGDQTESLLVEFSNDQLGDLINWIPYVLVFLEQKVNLFSHIVIKLKLYDFVEHVFSEYDPTSMRDQESGELSYVSLIDGKVVLSDIDNETTSKDYNIKIIIGIDGEYAVLHPNGVTISNQLGMICPPFERLKLENYYEPLSSTERDIMSTTNVGMWNSNGKHVCIGPHGTMKSKMWISYECEEDKWQTLTNFLVEMGYEVWWISREKCNIENVIDLSGEKYSIEDRIRQLLGCEFFVGLSSGLGWLANACGVQLFRIDGWTFDWHGLVGDEKVVSITSDLEGVCRGCYHDTAFNNREEYPYHHEYCPRNMDFQCSKTIPANQVIGKIKEYTQRN